MIALFNFSESALCVNPIAIHVEDFLAAKIEVLFHSEKAVGLRLSKIRVFLPFLVATSHVVAARPSPYICLQDRIAHCRWRFLFSGLLLLLARHFCELERARTDVADRV